MSFRGKRELLVQVAPRYSSARHGQRSVILDEFVAVTGYERKYAIRLLLGPIRPPAPIRRPRAAHYGPAVQEALSVVWSAANGICAKRMVPFLPELIPTLERHGHLVVTDEVRAQLLALSPATVDRLLRPLRQPHGLSTTKPGRLLKKQIPVRTFSEWTDVKPGFLEGDLVAHCGGTTDGAFLYTFTLTDIATTWTECLPLLHRTQHGVVHALERARGLFPFPILGIDTDNGSEFINEELLAYCNAEHITFTRGRVGNKNDQAWVEQKNGSVVRQLVGYDRFEGQRAYRQLAELYRAVRLYVNFFQPSMKLVTKMRTGSRVRRTYGPAQTPFQRVLASGVLDTSTQRRLNAVYRALDPVRLLHQLETLQEALWRHALFRSRIGPPSNAPLAVPFDLGASGLGSDGTEATVGLHLGTRQRRKYRRSEKSKGPRTYRTRPDPFAAVWDEVCQWLVVQPERTGRSVFDELQQRYPGQFADGQLRTLHRHIQVWRARTVLTFGDDGWLDDVMETGQSLPPPLRVNVDQGENAEQSA
jgi:integrase-like protein